MVSWKCLGEKQKTSLTLFDSEKVPTLLNDKNIKKWELYSGSYDLEGSKLSRY